MKHAASLSIALWVMALATGLVWLGQYAQPRLLLPYNEPSDATAGAIELAQLQAGLSQLRALVGRLSFLGHIGSADSRRSATASGVAEAQRIPGVCRSGLQARSD
jgi:hypothetical protein